MKRSASTRRLPLVLLLCGLLPACVSHAGSAGKIVTQTAEGGGGQFEILEFDDKGQLRLTQQGVDGRGIIATGDKFYLFGEVKGKPVVVDIAAAMKKAKSDPKHVPDSDAGVLLVDDLKPTGRKETIAGIEGEVFTVSWKMDGKPQGQGKDEAVLSRDPRLAGVLKTYSHDPGSLDGKPRAADLNNEALGRGYFPLRLPDRKVVSADFSAPEPNKRFALKAPPTDDPEMVFTILFAEVGEAMGQVMGQMGQAMGDALTATGTAMQQALSQAGDDAAKTPAADAKPLEPSVADATRQLLKIGKPFGIQPKAKAMPADPFAVGWTEISVGPVSMSVPPGWGTYGTQEESEQALKGAHPTASLVSADEKAWIELDTGWDAAKTADDAFGATAIGKAIEDYDSVFRRKKEGVMLGGGPLSVDGCFGNTEIMNEYGKLTYEGKPTQRMNSFRCHKRVGEYIAEVRFTGMFAQKDQALNGPLMLATMQTIRFNDTPPPAQESPSAENDGSAASSSDGGSKP